MTRSASPSSSRTHSDCASLSDSVSAVLHDERRLAALEAQQILDTEPEAAFDRITRLATDLLDVESALVNFISKDRQWFKSAVGFDEQETGLDTSLCVYTMEEGEMVVIEDATEDERVSDNPYVTEHGVRFYVGVPLETEAGHQIGTLCVFDPEPRSPTEDELRRLSDLAAIVEDELRLRRKSTKHRQAERQEEMTSTFFEAIATGTDTPEVLEELCQQAEQMVPGTRVSVLRRENDRLRYVAGSSLPSQYVEMVDGLAIGPSAGTCGAAAYHAKETITEDIDSDSRWDGYRGAIADTELQSCWSVPIRDGTGEVLGTFAVYGTESQLPSDEEQVFLRRMAHVASVALDRDRHRRALRESEERFRTVVENAQPVVFMLDADGTFLLSEGDDLEALGLQPGDVVGQSVFELYADAPGILDAVQCALDGQRVDRELEVDGLLFDSWFSPFYDAEGDIAGIIGMGADITDKRNQEEKLRMAVDAGTIGTWNWDLETDRVEFNRQWAEMLGYSRDELDFHFNTWEELVHPEDLPRAINVLERYVAGAADTYDPEIRMKTKDGAWRWIQTIGKVIDRDEEGRVRRVAGVHLDIHDRKQAEQDVRKSRERYRSLFQDSTDAILVHDLDGTVQEVNSQAESLFGMSAEQLNEQSLVDLHAPSEEETAREELDALRNRGTYEAVSRYERADGAIFWAEVVANKTEIGDGTVIRSLIRDVSDREETRRKLERYRVYTRRMLDAIDDLFFVIDDQARLRRWNDSVSAVTGYTDDEIGAMTAFEFVPDSEEERIAAEIGNGFMSGHNQVEIPLLRKNGTRIPYEFVGNRVRHPEGGFRMVGIGRDITERKRTERQLREERNFLDRILETSPVAIAVLNADGEFLEASSRAEDILGLDKTEVMARTYNDPEWRIRGPDGESIPDEELPFAQVMATEEPIYDFEHTIEWPDGTQRLLSVSGAPLHSANGDLEGAVFHMDDITERREAEHELARQNDLFAKAQAIADVGAWEYDVRTGEILVTEQVYHIHGMELDANIGLEQTINLFHPDDQSTLQDAFRRAVGKGEPYDLKLRMITTDGDARWVRTRGEPQWEDGKITRIRGTIQDITERHQQRVQLRERRQKVEVLYDATSALLRAQNKDEVADLLIHLIGETLGYSGTTIRFVEDDRLAASRVPEMVQGSMPARPAYALDGDTPAAQVYRSGDTQVFDDLSAERPELDRGDIRSTAYVPMGEHGLISVGSREIGGIGPFDLRLIEILGGYASLVLGRLDREQSLREAKEAAEEADRMKTALLSNMSHELRTPLTSILTFAALIDQNPDAADQFTGRILGGARRLLYTLNTVMEFAELEGEVDSGRRLDMNERCRLGRTVRSVIDDYREQAQEKGVALDVEVSKSSTIDLDSHLLERVLIHLLDNSVKFTEGGRIHVTATASEEVVELQVEDTGVGMDPAFVPRACDEFAQASTGLDRKYEGNGLGLTVTTRLVDRIGGTMEIESEPDDGTRVTLRLPTGGTAADGAPSGEAP